MKLDSLEKRHDIVKELIDETHDFKNLATTFDHDNDWAGAKVTEDNLVELDTLIRTEKAFLNCFDELSDTPYPNRDEKEHLLTIFLLEGVHCFIHEVFLPHLNHIFKVLSDWGFRTEDGQEFCNYAVKKLAALLKKYQELYDIKKWRYNPK